MEGELSLTPEQLANLSPEEILKLLDSGWPWPLDAVQEWFEALWNDILEYLYKVADWVWDKLVDMKDTLVGWFTVIKDWVSDVVVPWFRSVWGWITTEVSNLWGDISRAFSKVWDWIKTEVGKVNTWIKTEVGNVWDWLEKVKDWLWAHIQPALNSIWTTLGTIPGLVADKVAAINKWFSDEFIDPFIDWLVQFPGKFFEAAKNFLVDQWQLIWEFWSRDWNWLKLLTGMVVTFVGGAIVLAGPAIGAALLSATQWLGGALLRFTPMLGGWFTTIFSRLGGWLTIHALPLGIWARGLLPRLAGWFLGHMVTLLGAGGIITLEVTGQLEVIIRNFVTPAIIGVFDWFEAMGPVTPKSGKDMSGGVTRLAEFTISGLAAMTLAGEMLAPLKHVGLGHISAIIYDLINYKTLTAAFMGVLAFVYIKTPLTYYYQKMARPNIPEERALTQLAGEYAITKEEFRENMQWHGYPDEWIDKLYELADRPLTPFLFRYLGEAGILDEALLDRELHNAGYNEQTIPYLKTWLQRVSTGELRTLMVGTAMTRYKEGFDDNASLTQNLAALGVSDSLMSKYVFAAQLSYLTDYQSDLLAYYKDAYHRREIEEPELRRGLASLGLNPERLDLTVARESIKRLKTAAT